MKISILTAAFAGLLASCETQPLDVRAERETFEVVTGAELDRPDGQIDVSWPAYLEADPRLTDEERLRFLRFLDAWRIRVEEGERMVQAAGGGQ